MQNYKNHIRFNPLHHFVLAPLALALVVWSVVNLVNAEDDVVSALYFLLFALTLLILSFISRMYATKNQDRTIRLEMRLRYFQLTGKSFQEKESKLKTAQIIALRFASDEELIELIDRSIDESISAKEIKKSIKVWNPDYMRV
jgi:hypothetical protein